MIEILLSFRIAIPSLPNVTDAGEVVFLLYVSSVKHSPCALVMTTPSLLQIDDRDPLIFYSPNTSWTRGGAPSDFDGTSTFTSTAGASATLTFTGMHPVFLVLYSIFPIQLTAQRLRS